MYIICIYCFNECKRKIIGYIIFFKMLYIICLDNFFLVLRQEGICSLVLKNSIIEIGFIYFGVFKKNILNEQIDIKL